MKRGGKVLKYNDRVPALLLALPRELIDTVCAFTEWSRCGALARSCRTLMHHLTGPRAVQAIIDECERHERMMILEDLPRWIFYALPAHLIEGVPITFTWRAYSAGRSELAMPGSGERFYTGGDVAQRLYGKMWEGDIDVWVDAAPQPRPSPESPLDFVVNPDHLASVQQCLERFDLSVTQQGFLRAAVEKEPEFYATPLAVYSYHKKKLFISIHPLFFLNYSDLQNDDFLVIQYTITNLIHKHAASPHATLQASMKWKCPCYRCSCASLSYRDACFPLNRFMENCEYCMATAIGTLKEYSDEDERRPAKSHEVTAQLLSDDQFSRLGAVVRWTKRVMKYRNRFPDFDARYIYNPLVVRDYPRSEEPAELL